jgi:tRNA-splicing ligase RtcB
LEGRSDRDVEYLQDVAGARFFADGSRKAIAEQVGRVLTAKLGARICWETRITTDDNHVSLERLGGCYLWVHRKGAMSAKVGVVGVLPGVLPGSMGTLSFYVEVRGSEEVFECSTAQARH